VHADAVTYQQMVQLPVHQAEERAVVDEVIAQALEAASISSIGFMIGPLCW
jgi:hypothetical protein